MTRRPRLRPDGLCLQCKGERKLPEKKLYREQAEADPFCSRDCCVLWHNEKNGVPLVESSVWGSGSPGRNPGYEFESEQASKRRGRKAKSKRQKSGLLLGDVE